MITGLHLAFPAFAFHLHLLQIGISVDVQFRPAVVFSPYEPRPALSGPGGGPTG
ncbi:hypothetical protein CROQUDRAFT_655434 [Cronartium quercuum f. sp. fusiforme G11]|uniref:Uncharacterized protein n=1 Tax=Cronartium quercuum f. sp. fusiforme G11 TaxID=708437 RepID=A0A9P6NPU1_9BASI|nr:hypothetical protein CROQUDRAFT_655434 [Cronartium quercuum f. sp. fusiforme G11]